MEKLVKEANEKGAFNGTWLYAEKGKIISKGAVGFRDFEDRLPMREDSIFQLASITKQFTAAAVMLLVREGLLSLEDEVTKFYPQIPYPGVTIKHLLTHTGGIPETYDEDNWIIRKWKEEKKVPGSDCVIAFLTESGEEARFAPGDAFEYTNGGYNLLAEIVAKAAGVPFEEYLKKKIFEPAGMYHTGVHHIWTEGIPHDNTARNMVVKNSGHVPGTESAGREEIALDRPDGGHIPVAESADRDVIAFDGLNGDDYVYTDIFDMFIWDRALREEKVLTLEEQKLMYSTVKLNDGSISGADDDRDGYGFGWDIKNDEEFGLIVKHGGGMPGLNTWYERFMDADRVLVFMGCREPEDVRAEAAFWNGMRAIAMDRKPGPVETIEDQAIKDPDRSGWEAFCGSYDHPDEAEQHIDEVFLKEGELYARGVDEDGRDYTSKLYPIGENTFSRKRGWTHFIFSENELTFDGIICKKL
ncbi:MAG: beta-lactamase family protein [Lachnospiraceae bacterium]|nr:beta-lactamase family protein [Lachnospiraceae bacterium]